MSKLAGQGLAARHLKDIMQVRTSPHLHDFLSKHASDSPSSEAMVFGQQRWTYREANDLVDAVGRSLMARGIAPGDRVAMLSAPRPEFWVVLLAVLKIGALWVGLNPKYRRQELAFLLSDSKPALIVAFGPDSANTLDAGALRDLAGLPEDAVIAMDPEAGVESNLQRLSTPAHSVNSAVSSFPSIRATDPAILVYTSGSTGRPKGALIHHLGLAEGSVIQARHFRVNKPRLICNLPVNHVGCIADICSTTLASGGTLIFQEKFSPAEMLQTIPAERVSIIGGVPTMLIAMMEQPGFKTTDFSGVELVLWGGAAMPPQAVETWSGTGARLKGAYGMTETSCHVTFTSDAASVYELSETIGRPVDEIECRIVDPASFAPLEAGEAGELQFRGVTNFLGYFQDPEATANAVTADGWLKTGDLASFEPDGAIRLVGRLKEMFKSGGYNVYPREIELALEGHPAVAQAAVVSIPDSVFQEVGAAFVVLAPLAQADPDDLLGFLKTRLANYKVPKSLCIRSDMPLLPIGKIDKRALADAARGDSHQRKA